METKKNKEKYFCESCNFTTGYKQNYLKHLSTAKHRRVIFGNKKELGDFYCDCCDYRTVRKQNFIKHLATEVHLETKKDATLTCVYCEKKYKTRAGLWKHKKKCKIGKKIPLTTIPVDEDIETEMGKKTETLGEKSEHKDDKNSDLYKNIEKENNELKNMIKTLCNQNSKLMNSMSEQNQTIQNMVPKIGNQINNTHQNLNIQIFLHEKCKDALNIKDFIDTLKISLQDIEYTKANGISESVGNILANGLEKLDIYKRPIHCTNPDLKTLYIKDEDSWEKDNEKVVSETISDVKNKHIAAVKKWEKENPDWINNEAKTQQFMSMISKTTTNIEKEDETDIINKIVKKVEVK